MGLDWCIFDEAKGNEMRKACRVLPVKSHPCIYTQHLSITVKAAAAKLIPRVPKSPFQRPVLVEGSSTPGHNESCFEARHGERDRDKTHGFHVGIDLVQVTSEPITTVPHQLFWNTFPSR